MLNLKSQNTALLGKWWWCLLNDSGSVWSDIIKERYFRCFNPLQLSWRKSGKVSCFWKGVLSSSPTFKVGLIFKPRMGKFIKLWTDILLGDHSLSFLFPSLFGYARSANDVIHSQYSQRNEIISWKIR